MSHVSLPPTIRVAAFDFKVVEWDHLAAVAVNRFGEMSVLEFTIRVDVAGNPMKVVDTLLHEILHAVFWAYGIADADEEERVVGTLATAWTQVFRDNPALVAWLSEMMGGVSSATV